MAPAAACFFAMLADVADYHEWKTKARIEGTVYSAASFGQKAGAGLGAAILGWTLALGQFDGTLYVQPQSAMTSILIIYIYAPFALQIVNIILFSRYTLDKDFPTIMAELAERRKLSE